MFSISREQFSEWFPEFEEICGEELKHKIVKIWNETAGKSDWESMEDVPFSPDYPAQPNSFLQHMKLVTAYSTVCAKKNNELELTKVDMDTVIAGALLHDVCKLVEYSSAGGRTEWGKNVTHGIYGIAVCYEEKIPLEIIHIISSHTKQLTIANKTREAIIVAKADNLAAACVHLYEANRQ